MRTLLTLLVCCCLWFPLLAAPPDEGFESENKAQGVKPPKVPPPALVAKKDDDKPKAGDGKQDDRTQGNRRDGTVLSADEIDKIKKQENKDITVRGKVHEVYVNPNKTVAILNFGSNHRTCFKAVIFERNFEKWDKGLDEIKAYKGKTVQVSGKVGLRDDLPQIIIAVPSQIKKS